ncbi:MAG: hypothetical protein LBQ02_01350 [Candidatus Nomurabacteria bacterium]|jgi:hypothetical protein|nr:hypothetical protein [Candidatus Nomurabacteria bacterium]
MAKNNSHPNPNPPKWMEKSIRTAKKAVRQTKSSGIIRITVTGRTPLELFFEKGERKGDVSQVTNGKELRGFLDPHIKSDSIVYYKEPNRLLISLRITNDIRLECLGDKEILNALKPLADLLSKQRFCVDREAAEASIRQVTQCPAFKRVARSIKLS